MRVSRRVLHRGRHRRVDRVKRFEEDFTLRRLSGHLHKRGRRVRKRARRRPRVGIEWREDAEGARARRFHQKLLHPCGHRQRGIRQNRPFVRSGPGESERGGGFIRRRERRHRLPRGGHDVDRREDNGRVGR